MPYIKQEDREKFHIKSADLPSNSGIDLLAEIAHQSENYGDLNYAITVILKHFMNKKGEKYDTHNSIIGMLDSCKMEWYRKQVAPYENKKEKENGSV